MPVNCISGQKRLAVSTDAHVVSPLFYPGGDIGRLSVCGTVNDVAMLGAKPLYLTASFILEEGLEMETLVKVVQSMCAAAQEAGGEHHPLAIPKLWKKVKPMACISPPPAFGEIVTKQNIGGQYAKVGDKVILSGSMGDHGIAVLSARGELGFEAQITSDVAPLNGLIHEIISVSNNVHVLRDPTRGGVATTLNEIAKQSNLGIVLDEKEFTGETGGAFSLRNAGL